jgi:hypothetical protein
VNIRGSNHVISFGGSISGIAALQQVASVETVSYGGQGTAVCKINGVGNPPVPGQCLGEQSGTYWSYWRAGPGAGGFAYAGTGAGGTSVTDGSVEGWNFGNGPPPFSSFCSVAGCAPPPPPPPPPTPPPTAAPAPAGGSASPAEVGGTSASAGSGPDATNPKSGGSKSGKKGGDESSGGKGGATAGTGASDPTSTTRGDRRTSGGDSTQAAGPISLDEDGDANSPWGVLAAGAAVAGLGAAGMVIRRRRRATPL